LSDRRSPTRVELPDAFADLWRPSRYKAFWGGRGGAKSHSFARALLLKSLKQPLRILCAREIQKSIADSVKRLLDDNIEAMGVGHFFDSTLSEIRTQIGGLFIFAGLRSNIEAVKSTEGIDIAWCEEANSISQASIDILVPTIRKNGSEIWFSWNPKLEKDPVDKMFRGGTPPPDSIVKKVTWEDNPWFPDVLRKEMEWDRQRDPEKYAHVWLGEYVKNSEARVFKNWRVDTFDVPASARPYYGGDWGFAIDPTVLVRCWIIGRTFYIDKEAYEVGCPIDRTPALFDKIDGARKWPITADSARPETIDYMRRHGYPHIQAARKGPGSLEDGVEFLKSFDIIIHPDCKHTIDEFTLYSYKVDKLTGEVLPQLEDKKNNVIDAARYAAEQVRAFDGGVVYTAAEADIVIPSFKLPDHWPRVWALDVDGAKASALWATVDRESDTLYIYADCITGRTELSLVADAIRNRGSWIPGLFDHLSRKRKEAEGLRIVDALLDLKLDVFTVQADAEAAIAEIGRRFTTKRIKVFDTCRDWIAQYRAYRRNKDGDLVEESDGLMRAMDLLALSGVQIAAVSEAQEAQARDDWATESRDATTGY
jgi:phage terminase large subunit